MFSKAGAGFFMLLIGLILMLVVAFNNDMPDGGRIGVGFVGFIMLLIGAANMAEGTKG